MTLDRESELRRGQRDELLESDMQRRRLLVAIASYGEKNIAWLKQIIGIYRSMAMQVDVVVFSEAPKDLGQGVEVRVGLPSANPWSLPFAHKQLFAERCDQYDLFAYSEDDIEVKEARIDAFLRATAVLEPDEIAGFDLYEMGESGSKWLPGVHGHFHWKPESARKRGPFTIAEFTNEHAAFYLLTRDQLKRAIASGGFLKGPSSGRYDMLCTAATDPYTSCGFRKVMCVSELDSFLLYHLPNRYIGSQGLSLERFQEQVRALLEIAHDRHPRLELCHAESKMPGAKWSRDYYDAPSDHILRMVPKCAKSLLSIGCGCGATESALMERGLKVSALPLDSVIGASAAQRGIEMIYATLEDVPAKLAGRTFDYVLMRDLLHLVPAPERAIRDCAGLLRPGGCVVLAGPNFDYVPVLAGRALGLGGHGHLRSFAESGVNSFGLQQLKRWLRRAGLQTEFVGWHTPESEDSLSGSVRPLSGRRRWMVNSWRWLRRAGLRVDQALRCGSKSESTGWAQSRLGIGRFFGQTWVVRARSTPETDTR